MARRNGSQKAKIIAILAEDHMLDAAYGAVERLRAEGKNPSLVNIRFIRPLDGGNFAGGGRRLQPYFHSGR